MTDEKAGRLGKQAPRHTFFLNPYKDERFTRCPMCDGKTRQRKEPFAIHVEPKHVLVFNMTGRYCSSCDLVIVHQDVLEDLMARAFSQRDPSVIGNDYLVVGTVDRGYYRRYQKSGGSIRDLLDNLHDFKEQVTFTPEHYGWVHEDEEEDEG